MAPMRARALFFVSTLGLAGCRCGEPAREEAPSPPAMPSGMLAPLPAIPPRVDAVEALSMTRGKTAGEWIELQLAATNDVPDRRTFERWLPESRFLSLDAMTLLHDPFARALPGFDLFLPRLLDPPALARLDAELVAFGASVATLSLVDAKRRFASPVIHSLENEASWQAVRSALLNTVEELTGLARGLAPTGRGLWIVAS